MKNNLTEEQLSMVSGGFVVKVEGSSTQYVVDDNDGTILGCAVNGLAKILAGKKGVSTQTITPEWYESCFGRKFSPESSTPMIIGK